MVFVVFSKIIVIITFLFKMFKFRYYLLALFINLFFRFFSCCGGGGGGEFFCDDRT